MKECPESRQASLNGGNKAQSSSVAPPDRAAPRGATSGTGEQTTCMLSIIAKNKRILQMLSLV